MKVPAHTRKVKLYIHAEHTSRGIEYSTYTFRDSYNSKSQVIATKKVEVEVPEFEVPFTTVEDLESAISDIETECEDKVSDIKYELDNLEKGIVFETNTLVRVDDLSKVQVFEDFFIDGEKVRLVHMTPPHKPGSSGHVTVRYVEGDYTREYYPNVIGCLYVNVPGRDL